MMGTGRGWGWKRGGAVVWGGRGEEGRDQAGGDEEEERGDAELNMDKDKKGGGDAEGDEGAKEECGEMGGRATMRVRKAYGT